MNKPDTKGIINKISQFIAKSENVETKPLNNKSSSFKNEENINIFTNSNQENNDNIVTNNEKEVKSTGKQEKSEKDCLSSNVNEPFKDKIDWEITNTADCSVLSFLNVIIKINRDLRILSYRENEEIKSKIQDFQVNMGFGLHTGWAIEGAIGSTYKIDASYLSPNVNMAARLEAATRQYGVKLLFSGNIYELLSDELKEYCRIIDIVTVKGSIEPIKIYTIDVNEDLKPEKKVRKDFSDKNKRERQNMQKDLMKNSMATNSLTKKILNKKQFKRLLTHARSYEFYKSFNSGFKYYIDGDWQKAKINFLKCTMEHANDGPVNTLYSYIESFNFSAPADWKGYRSLVSK